MDRLAKCPVCQSEVSGTFGMVMCPKCQTPLFFDFDGIPQVAETENADQSFRVEVQESDQSVYKSSSQDSGRPIYESAHRDSDQAIYEPPTQDSANATYESALQDFDHSINEGRQNFDRAFQETAEVGEFVSSEKSEALSGENEASSLFYEIEIDGIDGTKLRNELYQELKDPRWGWVAMELMGEIQLGRLVLRNINAVKASLLVNRLKALPLEIKWKQYV